MAAIAWRHLQIWSRARGARQRDRQTNGGKVGRKESGGHASQPAFGIELLYRCLIGLRGGISRALTRYANWILRLISVIRLLRTPTAKTGNVQHIGLSGQAMKRSARFIINSRATLRGTYLNVVLRACDARAHRVLTYGVSGDEARRHSYMTFLRRRPRHCFDHLPRARSEKRSPILHGIAWKPLSVDEG
jgi:hypothetical protein